MSQQNHNRDWTGQSFAAQSIRIWQCSELRPNQHPVGDENGPAGFRLQNRPNRLPESDPEKTGPSVRTEARLGGEKADRGTKVHRRADERPCHRLPENGGRYRQTCQKGQDGQVQARTG